MQGQVAGKYSCAFEYLGLADPCRLEKQIQRSTGKKIVSASGKWYIDLFKIPETFA